MFGVEESVVWVANVFSVRKLRKGEGGRDGRGIDR